MKTLMHNLFMICETLCWMIAIIEPGGIFECGILTVLVIEAAAIAGGLACHHWAWEGYR